MKELTHWETALSHQGLIKSYLDKNRWIIDKSHTLEWEDYWQIGVLALHKAASRYDQTKGKFSSYAWQSLKWNMTRAYKTQAYPIMRVPEKKHPPKELNVSAMTYQESFTWNVLNCRVDLSATNYMKLETYESTDELNNFDDNSGMFVFFE